MPGSPSEEKLKKRIKKLEDKLSKCEWEASAYKEREELLTGLIEECPQGILVHNNLRPLFLNQRFAEIHGYTTHEILEMNTILPLIAFSDRFRLSGHTPARLRMRKTPLQENYHGVRKDGSSIILDNRVALVNWDGQPGIQLTVFELPDEAKKKEWLASDIRQLTGMIEEIPYGVCRFDPAEGAKFQVANRAFLEMFNIGSEKQLSTLKWYDLFPNQMDLDKLSTEMEEQKSISGYEIVMQKTDGTLLWAEISAWARFHEGDDDNSIAYVECIIEDITNWRHMEFDLQEKEVRFRSIIENSPQGILIHKNLEPLFVNQAYGELFGYSQEEILDLETILPLIAPSDRERIEKYNEARQKGESAPIQYEFQGQQMDGSLVWLDSWGTEVNWKGEVAVQETIFDISYRKRAERALLKAKQDLESANSKLTDMNNQLEKAISKANEMGMISDKANTAKSEFMTNVTHQFRKPLNIIIGMIDLLLNTRLNIKQLEYVKTVQKNADTLLALLNDILDFSKIKEENMELESIEFDLKTTLEDVAGIMEPKAREKKLQFACLVHNDIPSPVRGDPWRLRQVLINLINNAIKFTDEGEVIVRASMRSETDEEAVIAIAVSDTGSGIPTNEQNDFLNSFSQMDEENLQKYGGIWLGLAISKQIVEMMGGKITLESIEGKGSSFRFTAVFKKVSAERLASVVLPMDIKGKRILVADANSINLEILCGYLKLWECRYKAVSTAKEALSFIRNAFAEGDPFHVAIISHMPPELDGEALGTEIQNEPNLAGTSMIMLTSKGERGDAARVRDIGFSGYFVQPVKSEILFDCLMTILGETEDNKNKIFITRHTLAESKMRIGFKG